MAGSRDIKAGRAFVEIAADNGPLRTSLAKATGMLKSWGSSLSSIGGMVSGIWAGITTGAIANAVNQFATVGSELHDMAARTGLAASELQTLKFAASQSGASLEDVERALRHMAKGGIPVSQFEQLGQSIAAIKDPTERAERALDVFGKTGTKLLPMFSEFKTLKAQSAALGPVLTQEDVDRADALGDAIGALAEAWSRLNMQIGSTFSTQIKTVIDTLTGAMIELAQELRGDFSDVTHRDNPFVGLIEMFERIHGKGAKATAAFKSNGVAAMDEELSQKKDDSQKREMQMWQQINRAIERRNHLIQEFETEGERFLRKRHEIDQALGQVHRNALLGFMSPEEADAQRSGLQEARRRLSVAEQERLARLRPKIEETIKPQLADLRGIARGTFSATGAGLLGRDAAGIQREQLTELKGIRRAVEKQQAGPKFT